MPRITKEHDFISSIMNADLSDLTKRGYLERLKYILTQTNKDIYFILTHPKKYATWINETFDALTTRKSYFGAILAVFRHNEGLKQQWKKHYHEWYQAFQAIHTQVDERYKKNEPTEKQENGYVPYQEIILKRDTLPRGSDERLLLGFYTYIPPLRADLNRVRIYEDALPKQIDEPNYIFIDHKKNVATFILQEFKTSASLDKYEKTLPAELVKEIQHSMDKNPRSYLFEDRNGKPYRASSFTKWANRTLNRLFARNLTISLIRHSFINSLDFNTITIHEKEAIAKDMAHTVETQDRYRLIFKNKKPEPENAASQ